MSVAHTYDARRRRCSVTTASPPSTTAMSASAPGDIVGAGAVGPLVGVTVGVLVGVAVGVNVAQTA
jgi:hypothetical protein